MSNKQNKVGAPIGNKNAEKWDLKGAVKLFEEAINLARDGQKTEEGHLITYDFIGEIARDLKIYRELFSVLLAKFPQELKSMHSELQTILESNCFSHSKKGEIIPSVAIVNLKSNYGWTDRVDQTTKGEKVDASKIDLSHLSLDQLKDLMNEEDDKTS